MADARPPCGQPASSGQGLSEAGEKSSFLAFGRAGKSNKKRWGISPRFSR